MEQLTKDYVKYMTGKDVDVIITATGEGSGYIRGDQLGEGKNDVFVWDLKQLADGGSVTEIIGHETNHIDDHRRDRESHNETDSNSLGGRFKENLGEDGKNNGFDLGKWLSQGDNQDILSKGENILDTEYNGYEMERSSCMYVHGVCLKKDEAQKTIDRYNNMKVGKDLSGASLVLDFIPVVGDAKGIIEAAKGRDLLTNEELNLLERALGLVFLGEIKGVGKAGGKALKSIKILKKSDEVVMVLTDGTKVVTKKSDIASKVIKNSDNASGAIKNTYKSIKEAPKYPKNFKDIQNGVKKVNVNDKKILENLRKVESGEWKKVYRDGYIEGKKVSIHYFQHSKTGKVFDVDVKYNKWSNKH